MKLDFYPQLSHMHVIIVRVRYAIMNVVLSHHIDSLVFLNLTGEFLKILKKNLSKVSESTISS